jgi:5-methylcytosine-specific restriction endonuclease McrA
VAEIPSALREAVIARAGGRCEYCQKPPLGYFRHEVDHVVALKHGGRTTMDNLALACFNCNRFKGSDLSSIDPETDAVTPLFNPRTQVWADHFRRDAALIEPRTAAGRVTVFLLRLNAPERVRERLALERDARG